MASVTIQACALPPCDPQDKDGAGSGKPEKPVSVRPGAPPPPPFRVPPTMKEPVRKGELPSPARNMTLHQHAPASTSMPLLTRSMPPRQHVAVASPHFSPLQPVHPVLPNLPHPACPPPLSPPPRRPCPCE